MKKVVVLGAGLMGTEIARDLKDDYKVSVSDINSENLRQLESIREIKIIKSDLSSNADIQETIKDFDLVINALPGHMGYKTLRQIVSDGKDVVDISFGPENPFQLDGLAKKRDVTAVVDCGVAPGLCNMVLGYENAKMAQVDSYECMVGGLPVQRDWPFEYKAVFSPIDVIEEYTRPSHVRENGTDVIYPALTEKEYIPFKEVGTLEAFNTDGLRTLLKTMKIPNMKEKTLRYPGHAQLMKVFRETGFFDKHPIKIGDHEVVPMEFTARVLFPSWKRNKKEADFTVMRIVIIGIYKHRFQKVIYNLYDQYDKKNNVSSMARTTGYTCTAAARLLLDGDFTQKGICPPEYIGQHPKLFEKVLKYLKEHKIQFEVEHHHPDGDK